MRFWDLLRIANRNLFRNKLRTFLTVAAIFVGSFTLTMTNGIGDGMRSYVESQIKNFESDSVLMVRRKIERPEGAGGSGPREYKENELNGEDDDGEPFDRTSALVTVPQMDTALNGVTNVKSVTPRYSIAGEYITVDGQKKYRAELGMLSQGITQKTEAGSTITGDGQIVIPIGLARALDEKIENLIGKTATVAYKDPTDQLKTVPVKIVGVATKGFMTNTSSFVDAATAKLIHLDQKHEEGFDKFYAFSVQLESADPAKIDDAKSLLESRGFTAETMADNQKRTSDALGIFKIGMSLIALIALLAASFGIINTLVIAVLERTKEIGLQKALGMGRGKIFAIFSLESVLIGFWGAVLGTVAGIVVGLIVNKVLVTSYAESFEGFTLFVFTLPSIAIVMALVCGIAFVAGVMPAIRASRLNPIESLRYE